MKARDLSKVMGPDLSDATWYTGFSLYEAANVLHQYNKPSRFNKYARSVINWKHVYVCVTTRFLPTEHI